MSTDDGPPEDRTPTGPADGDAGTADLLGSDAPTGSERHRLLASDRRRLALAVLADLPTPVDLADLAAELVAREDGSGAAGEDPVWRTAISLHHHHLPRMADAGVVEYDPTSRRIDVDD